MNFIIHNDTLCLMETLSFSASNHNFEGVFETMLFQNGSVPLFPFHAERMLKSIEHLGIKVNYKLDKILEQIETLVKTNNLTTAKIKWQVFKDDYKVCHMLIESIPIEPEIFSWNTEGWNLGLLEWEDHKDFNLNNLKYIRPQFYAKTKQLVEENKWDDAILSFDGKIIESSIGNIFIIKDEFIATPPLRSGCVAGVMRRFVLEDLKKMKKNVKEIDISSDEIFEADEIFITNALRGIKWVKRVENKSFQSIETKSIFNNISERIDII